MRDQFKRAFENLDKEQFKIREIVVADEDCYLITPNSIGAKWNKENIIFRSAIITKNFEPVSIGYKKFVNWLESPDLDPAPKSLNGCSVVDKLDGSALYFSLYKNNLIVRTRGTYDARALETGDEIDGLLMKNHRIAAWLRLAADKNGTAPYTILTEWYSPRNIIVLRYGEEPRLWLTNIVNHSDYSYTKQPDLDVLAIDLGLERPATYYFDSIEDMLKIGQELTGKEGYCVYYNDYQSIRKHKAIRYLALHKLKSELSSSEKVLDLWLELNRPGYKDFYDYVSTTFDFEIAEQIRGDISKICDAAKEMRNILDGMERFVYKIKELPTRKEQAVAITGAYGETNRAGFLFSILDGKPLEKDNYKKLIFQIIK